VNTRLIVAITGATGAIYGVRILQRLREVGQWLAKAGDAVYGTRGGPWEPLDGKFGYCYKGSTVFVHLLKDYSGTTFTMPPIGSWKVRKVYEVLTQKPLPYDGGEGREIVIREIDRTTSPADSLVAVEFENPIRSIWAD